VALCQISGRALAHPIGNSAPHAATMQHTTDTRKATQCSHFGKSHTEMILQILLLVTGLGLIGCPPEAIAAYVFAQYFLLSLFIYL